MKIQKLFLFSLLSLLLFLPGCDAIVGIFEAGFWTAIFLVVVIIALIVFAIAKIKK